jgi:hypothetical protein
VDALAHGLGRRSQHHRSRGTRAGRSRRGAQQRRLLHQRRLLRKPAEP